MCSVCGPNATPAEPGELSRRVYLPQWGDWDVFLVFFTIDDGVKRNL